MITEAQKDLVRGTVPILKEHGVTLTKYFYSRMFSHHPELRNVFNMGNQQNAKQQTALAMAVLAYAEHIENPTVLLPVLDAIGQKHTSLSIRPEHYRIVGKHLIASIREVLGDLASDELIDAWTVAYGQLAELMANHEGQIYQKLADTEGGWTGWRPFAVRKKEAESDEITSFYLYPVDGGKIADFKPGQFISVRIFVPQLNLFQPRQYSISCAPNGTYYRISVKREFGGELNFNGMVSNRLHDFINTGDIIDVSAPAGNFVLSASENPVVFISGGVGQTPLISMMEDLIASCSDRPKAWIHGCRSRNLHAFHHDLAAWKTGADFERHIFYDAVDAGADPGSVRQGWVDLQHIDKKNFAPNSEYYICGPASFITKHYNDLIAAGVDRSFIFFEEFGPQTIQLN
ncbi:NO-inducible flavohemoprotein [Mucilaginibacter conchicola]|uniref:NO-inducible flavohemoprotein n=1 Tax=Mucilaginibacter conchicola TaxID=2303333 RepID=UPI001F20CA12|nr:NO-inducible flavohemoprotein [Mucilaginibacter conchicola]